MKVRRSSYNLSRKGTNVRPIVRHPDAYPRSGGCQATVRRDVFDTRETASTVDLQNAVIVAHSPLSFAHITDDLRNTDIVAVYR